jgi:hypothetical protein
VECRQRHKSEASDLDDTPVQNGGSAARQHWIWTEFGFKGACFEAVLHRGQEACCVCAVDEPMVVGQCQIHHRSDGDCLPGLGLDHNRTVEHGPGAKNGYLGLIDDGGVE